MQGDVRLIKGIDPLDDDELTLTFGDASIMERPAVHVRLRHVTDAIVSI
jgi:hypothetical protein